MAQEELADWMRENPGNDEPHDAIFEIVDGSVPIYTGDLMQLAADNISLATDEPELGPAFGGEATPVNIVAANVFEHIQQELWEYWNEHKDGHEEGDTD